MSLSLSGPVCLSGVFGEVVNLRRDRHLSSQLEKDRPGSHSVGVQGVGRSGCVERGLLSDPQRHHRRGHVSLCVCCVLLIEDIIESVPELSGCSARRCIAGGELQSL